jgi:hypothetical protein
MRPPGGPGVRPPGGPGGMPGGPGMGGPGMGGHGLGGPGMGLSPMGGGMGGMGGGICGSSVIKTFGQLMRETGLSPAEMWEEIDYWARQGLVQEVGNRPGILAEFAIDIRLLDGTF